MSVPGWIIAKTGSLNFNKNVQQSNVSFFFSQNAFIDSVC